MRGRFLAAILLGLLLGPAGHAQAPIRKLSRSERKEHIKSLSEKYQQFLAEVEPVMQPEELDTFLQLESDAQRDLYIEDFWHRRAVAQGVSVTEVRERYYERLRTVKEKYRSIASDRGRIYLIQGEPLEVKSYGGFAGCRMVQPLEVWTYGVIPGAGHNVRLVFYVPRASIEYRLWLTNTPSDLISSEVMAGASNNESTAMQQVFGPSQTCSTPLRRMTELECKCPDGGDILGVINQGRVTQSTWIKAFEPPAVNPEDVRRILHSVVLVNPAATVLPAEFSVAFPSRQGSRTDAQMTILVPRSKLVLKDVAGVKSYSVDVVGEVLKDEQLFERYRYHFDYPGDVATDSIAVVIDRFLLPAEYKSRIKVSDLNSKAEAVIEKTIVVPEIAARAKGEVAVADDIDSAGTRLRIVPLPDELLTGSKHIDTITSGDDIKSVEFYLDGVKVMTKRTPPFALDLDLGDVPQVRRIRAVALNEKGEFVAGDELVVNSGGGDFRVRIVAPRVALKLSGPTRLQVAVTVPENKKIEKLDLYLNDVRIATLFGPPYVLTVDLPAKLAYLRAVATLAGDEARTAEDVVLINTPQSMAEVNVHLVELPTTVTRNGRPVADLPQSAFTVLDEGKPVAIAKFEQVAGLPLSLGLAIDTSTSMQPRMAEAQKAGAEFVTSVMKKGDKAFLVAFDSQPHVVQAWSANAAELTSGLAHLRTDESTALYDAIVYSLYNFTGTSGQKALIVITDGKDTSSKFSFDQATEYARRAGVPVYAIGIGIGGADVDVRYRLGKFCSETGGNVYYIEQASDLHRIYNDIQTELRSQYILGFYPPESAKGRSKWHTVSVQVNDGKAKTIRGYYP